MKTDLRGFRRVLLLAGALAGSAGALLAQESRGTIVGLVTDPDGRPLEAVTVEALNVATGVAASSSTAGTAWRRWTTPMPFPPTCC